MNIKKRIIDYFEITADERNNVKLMTICSFFMGLGMAFYYTPSTALFLLSFERTMLPWSFITGGIIVYLFGIVYQFFHRKASFSLVILFSNVFIFISIFTLSVLNSTLENKSIDFVIFVWIKVILFVQAVGFWGIAGKIFTLQQSKRLFSLIGAGEVIAFVIGFFATPFLIRFLYVTNNHLLFLSLIGFLLSCFYYYKIIIFNTLILKDKTTAHIKTTILKTSDVKLKKPGKYYVYLLMMAVFPIFAIIYIDYIFFAQSQISFYGQPALLSGFLAIFFGVSSLIEFLIKTLVSGKLITKYGLKLGLPILPVILIFCILLASFTGVIFSTAILFFAYLALSKLFNRTLRSAFYDPSYQVLFQPLPQSLRFMYQSNIEGGPRALANVVAGISLILLGIITKIELIHFCFAFLAILLLWLRVSFIMYKNYQKKLISNLKELENKDVNKCKVNTFDLKLISLMSANNRNFDQLLNIIISFYPEKIEMILTNLLNNLNNKNINIVLENVNNLIVITALPKITEQIEKFNDKIEDLTRIKEKLEEYKTISSEKLSSLIKSSINQERIKAALILNYISTTDQVHHLKSLLSDTNRFIRKFAILAAGKNKNFEILPFIIDNLENEQFRSTCVASLKLMGEPVLDSLEDHFLKTDVDTASKLKIIDAYVTIGGKKVIKLLRAKINHADSIVKEAVIIALNKLDYKTKYFERQHIKTVFDTEISFIVWLAASIRDLKNNKKNESLVNALTFLFLKKREVVINYISTLYDSNIISQIEENLSSGTKDAYSYALEILEMLISEDLRDLIIHILELSEPEKIVLRYKNMFPQQTLTTTERLKDIINKDFTRVNRWVKACALEILADYPDGEFITILSAYSQHGDIFIRQAAQISLNTFFDMETDSSFEVQYPFSKRVKIMKNFSLFKIIDETTLSDIAINTEIIQVSENKVINPIQQSMSYSFLVIEGELGLFIADELLISVPQNALASELTLPLRYNFNSKIKAVKKSILLKIDNDLLLNKLSDNENYINTFIDLVVNYKLPEKEVVIS